MYNLSCIITHTINLIGSAKNFSSVHKTWDEKVYPTFLFIELTQEIHVALRLLTERRQYFTVQYYMSKLSYITKV